MREFQEAGRADQDPLTVPLADEICDYFGVKIAMYFAWLGFYTSAMVYPAVFGSVLYTFTEADQVLGMGWAGAGVPETPPSSLGQLGQQLSLLPSPDKPGCFLCGFCPLQRGLVDPVLGGVETEGGRAGLQMGDAGLTWRSCGGATTPVQGQSGVSESTDSKSERWRWGALQGRDCVKLHLRDWKRCTRCGHHRSKGVVGGN